MKRIALVGCLLLSATLVFASADVIFGIGVQDTDIHLTMTRPQGGGSSETKFTAKASMDLTMIGSKNMGAMVAFTPDFVESSFGLYTAFAYRGHLSKNIACIFSVGPQLTFQSNLVTLGVNALADFIIPIGSKLSARLGVGAKTEFLQCPSGSDATTNLTLIVPMPSFALCWGF